LHAVQRESSKLAMTAARTAKRRQGSLGKLKIILHFMNLWHARALIANARSTAKTLSNRLRNTSLGIARP
jgi:hypothetical protein